MKIVAMGGGTGLPVVLSGLRAFSRSGLPGAEHVDLDALTAIVSVSDDGGSSGRLMTEFDTLPPGDVRNCLVALADDDGTSLLKTFLAYRFAAEPSGALVGHSVGNLLITALLRLNDNDFARAIADVAQILKLRGRIALPTLERHALVAELQSGECVRGESRIRLRWSASPVARVRLERASGAGTPLRAEVAAVAALERADLIVLGPGSLFTSVMPSLLVPDVARALAERSREVPVVYFCNLMTEGGETDRFTVGDHVAALLAHVPGLQLRWCVANRTPISPQVLYRYAVERFALGYRTVAAALDEIATSTEEADPPSLEALAEHAQAHATRLRILGDEMNQVVDHSIQVRLDPESFGPNRPTGWPELLLVDAAEEVEIVDRGRRKRVIRHNAQAVLTALFEELLSAPLRPASMQSA